MGKAIGPFSSLAECALKQHHCSARTTCGMTGLAGKSGALEQAGPEHRIGGNFGASLDVPGIESWLRTRSNCPEVAKVSAWEMTYACPQLARAAVGAIRLLAKSVISAPANTLVNRHIVAGPMECLDTDSGCNDGSKLLEIAVSRKWGLARDSPRNLTVS
jgi:hypothetical protein